MSLPKRETGEEQDWPPGGSLATAAHNEGKTVMKHAHLSTGTSTHTQPSPSTHQNGQLRLFLLLSDKRGHQSGPRLHEGGDETSLCTQPVVVGGDCVPKSIDLCVNCCKQWVYRG